MKASQIDAGLGYQCSEASHEIQWFEDDVGGTVVPGGFERVANLAVCVSDNRFSDTELGGQVLNCEELMLIHNSRPDPFPVSPMS